MSTISVFPDPAATTPDLHATASADLALARRLEDVRQRAVQALQLFQGEWFLDVRAGVPYLQQIFRRPASVAVASSILTRTLLAVEGVERVYNVAASFEPTTRAMTWTATLDTIYGTTTVQRTVQ